MKTETRSGAEPSRMAASALAGKPIAPGTCNTFTGLSKPAANTAPA